MVGESYIQLLTSVHPTVAQLTGSRDDSTRRKDHIDPNWLSLKIVYASRKRTDLQVRSCARGCDLEESSEYKAQSEHSSNSRKHSTE